MGLLASHLSLTRVLGELGNQRRTEGRWVARLRGPARLFRSGLGHNFWSLPLARITISTLGSVGSARRPLEQFHELRDVHAAFDVAELLKQQLLMLLKRMETVM